MLDVTKATEKRGPGGFIAEEANGTISRETVTILEAGELLVGTVLGKITASGKYKVVDLTEDDGSEVAAGILYRTVDTTDEDKVEVIIARHAEVVGTELVYPTGYNPTQIATINAQLEALQIKVL